MKIANPVSTVVVLATIAAVGADAHDDAIGGDFSIQRLANDQWRVEYCLDRETTAIRWDTTLPGMRDASWRVEDSELQLVLSEGLEAVVAADRSSFQCAALVVDTYLELGPKHYYAFSPFSDGGMSVFGGYYTGEAFVDGGWHELDLRAQYVGRSGEIVIGSQNLQREFIYFGPQVPIEAPTARLIVDPTVPEDISRLITQSMGNTGDSLYDTLGWRPREPYDVLIAAGRLDEGDGFSVKGGALDRQILFTLKGKGTLDLVKREPLYFPKLVAHEVLHLWQNDLWPELGSENPWVHEGSADALAVDILFSSGLIDSDGYAESFVDALVQCPAKLQGTSVHMAPEEGRFDVVYVCGAMLNWIVGAALGSGDLSAGLKLIWRAMASQDERRRAGEGEALWLETIGRLGIPAEGIDALRKFLSTRHADPRAALESVQAVLREHSE